jgi:hypothetical protein
MVDCLSLYIHSRTAGLGSKIGRRFLRRVGTMLQGLVISIIKALRLVDAAVPGSLS